MLSPDAHCEGRHNGMRRAGAGDGGERFERLRIVLSLAGWTGATE